MKSKTLGGMSGCTFGLLRTEPRKVDFLLVNEQGILCIEVKASTKLRPEHLKDLRAIKNLPSLYLRVLVDLGDGPQRTEDGIDVLPIVQFVDELAWSPS